MALQALGAIDALDGRARDLREALRALKRNLANVVYRAMLADAQQPALAKAA